MKIVSMPRALKHLLTSSAPLHSEITSSQVVHPRSSAMNPLVVGEDDGENKFLETGKGTASVLIVK